MIESWEEPRTGKLTYYEIEVVQIIKQLIKMIGAENYEYAKIKMKEQGWEED